MDRDISQLYLLPNLLKRDNTKEDQIGIPTACRESFLSKDDKRTYNEYKNWVHRSDDNVPIWSRLKYFNCLGQQRQQTNSKENNYDVEIPNRLLSLWGSMELTDKMQKFQGYHLINNVLAICASLKYNLDRWSPAILDTIATTSLKTYPELMRKHNIFNNVLRIHHLNSKFHLEGSQFEVRLHQVAMGVLYISYGLNEYNLARALMWFFKYYQFGLLQCQERCLAFGFAVDMDQGYFMYDCQSTGLPLFKANCCNSYVLRTNHLQILLYCMIVSLAVISDNVKFVLYSVDAQMEDVAGMSQSPAGSKPKSRFNLTNYRMIKKPVAKAKPNRLQAGNDKENQVPRLQIVKKTERIETPNDYGFWKIKINCVNTLTK